MGHGPVVGHDAVFSWPQSFSTIYSIYMNVQLINLLCCWNLVFFIDR